jgi:hypothetical protein
VGDVGGDETGADAGHLTVEGILLRAALLAGYGAGARPLARRLAAMTRIGEARSCLDAGSPIQFTVDAPGPVVFRTILRVGDLLRPATFDGILAPGAGATIESFLARLPPSTHSSLGTWLGWTEACQSVYVDVRDPSAAQALARLRHVLTDTQRVMLDHVRPMLGGARPWALQLETDNIGQVRVRVHWLLPRGISPGTVADTLAPGAWSRVVETLRALLKRPGESGRWVVSTPLDSERNSIRIANTAWTLVPEHADKQRAIGHLMTALGGPREYAEALWSFFRGAATPGWRVGRACEIEVGQRVSARLFLVPEVHGLTTAGMTNSASEMS